MDNRLVGFLHELKDNQTPEITEENTQQAFETMEKLQPENTPSDPITAGDIVDAVINQSAKNQLESGTISEEEYNALESFSQSLNNTATGYRLYLWKSALNEIKCAALWGQGPFFFQSKYGTYPHNFFLELATDFGLIPTLAILLLGLYVFFRIIRLALCTPVYKAFLLYVLAFFPQDMVSGSIYGDGVFFRYGFCILLAFLHWNTLDKH